MRSIKPVKNGIGITQKLYPGGKHPLGRHWVFCRSDVQNALTLFEPGDGGKIALQFQNLLSLQITTLLLCSFLPFKII